MRMTVKSLLMALALVALGACGQGAPTTTTGGAQSSSAPSSASSPAASSTQNPTASGASSPAASDSGARLPSESATTSGSTSGQSQGGPVKDQASLIDNLRAMGLTVETVGNVEQPFLQANGTTLRVSGGKLAQAAEIQVFNYESADAAQSDASQIGPDGNPRTTMITWVAPPHFFRAEQVIALYVGNDQDVITALTQALGPQFAGK